MQAWTKMCRLSPDCSSTLRATIDVSPSTFRRNRLWRPCSSVIDESSMSCPDRLYTFTTCVVVPMVVKTVSNDTTSSENSSLTLPSSAYTASLRHPVATATSAINTTTYRLFRICLIYLTTYLLIY